MIAEVLESDLAAKAARKPRRTLLLGTDHTGADITILPAGISVMVAGSSGSGKSTFATGVLERLQAQGYQFCIIDPEGDYADFGDAVVLGHAQRAPSAEEVVTALKKPEVNVVVNLIGLPLKARPEFFLRLLPRLHELRVKTVNVIAVLGEAPASAIEKFCRATQTAAPASPLNEVGPGQALVWFCGADQPPSLLNIAPSRTERSRHRRKFAEGELPPERSFFFRGPDGKLNLRAQNLILFNQIAEGVDDDTWMHHLRQGDYSRWVRACIKDDSLADHLAAVERQPALSASESRRLIREAVEEDYTLPAAASAET